MTQLLTMEQVEKLVEKAFNNDAHLDPALEGERNGDYMFLYGQIKHYQRSGNWATYKELAGIIAKAWALDEISWNHFEVLMKTLKKDSAK
jgi:hypothetical protein